MHPNLIHLSLKANRRGARLMTPQLTAMKTEAKKRYNSGFELTEGELRRLHDLMVQQIKKRQSATPS